MGGFTLFQHSWQECLNTVDYTMEVDPHHPIKIRVSCLMEGPESINACGVEQESWMLIKMFQDQSSRFSVSTTILHIQLHRKSVDSFARKLRHGRVERLLSNICNGHTASVCP